MATSAVVVARDGTTRGNRARREGAGRAARFKGVSNSIESKMPTMLFAPLSVPTPRMVSLETSLAIHGSKDRLGTAPGREGGERATASSAVASPAPVGGSIGGTTFTAAPVVPPPSSSANGGSPRPQQVNRWMLPHSSVAHICKPFEMVVLTALSSMWREGSGKARRLDDTTYEGGDETRRATGSPVPGDSAPGTTLSPDR